MCQKITYATKAEALQGVSQLKAQHKKTSQRFRKNPKNGKKLTIYDCSFCDGWHTTTAKKRKY